MICVFSWIEHRTSWMALIWCYELMCCKYVSSAVAVVLLWPTYTRCCSLVIILSKEMILCMMHHFGMFCCDFVLLPTDIDRLHCDIESCVGIRMMGAPRKLRRWMVILYGSRGWLEVLRDPHGDWNKSSALAEMGDRLATIDMGGKVGTAVLLSVGGGSWVPI